MMKLLVKNKVPSAFGYGLRPKAEGFGPTASAFGFGLKYDLRSTPAKIAKFDTF